MADEHDDGPSDPAKVRATITSALAAGLIELPGAASIRCAAKAEAIAKGELTGFGAISPLPNPQPQPVTLYRAIDALGGVGNTSFHEGWNAAIDEALTILTERGFTEDADAINPERLDVTKRPDVRQNALLAAEVLDRWRNDPTSEFTHGDASRIIGSIRQLLAAHDDMEVHRDAARDALSDMRDERDRLTRQLADMTTNRDALDEACQRKDIRIKAADALILAAAGTNPDAADRVACILPDATPDVVASIVQAVTEAMLVPLIATHATRPEVEILLAGRADLMRDILARTDQLQRMMPGTHPYAEDETLRETCRLLDRLGAYIVGQDTRLIAAGEALAEAQSELAAAVADRDKADAARGKAERDHSVERRELERVRDNLDRFIARTAWVNDEFNTGGIAEAYRGTHVGELARIIVRDLRSEIEQHKSDVAMAERAYETELRKRQEVETRCSALEMRIEGAIFALRHGMNEGVEASAAMFSPSTSLIDYLAAPLDGKAPTIPARGLYNDKTIEDGVEGLRQSLRILGMVSNGDRPDKLAAIVERQLLAAGLLPERHYKPRFRVVTSPRFYSDEDRDRAVHETENDPDGFWLTEKARFRIVDIVAAAIGMRRAAS